MTLYLLLHSNKPNIMKFSRNLALLSVLVVATPAAVMAEIYFKEDFNDDVSTVHWL